MYTALPIGYKLLKFQWTQSFKKKYLWHTICIEEKHSQSKLIDKKILMHNINGAANQLFMK